MPGFPIIVNKKTSTAQKPETLNLGLSVPGMLEFRLPKPRCTTPILWTLQKAEPMFHAPLRPHILQFNNYTDRKLLYGRRTQQSKNPFTMDPGFSVKAQGFELKVGIFFQETTNVALQTDKSQTLTPKPCSRKQ